MSRGTLIFLLLLPLSVGLIHCSPENNAIGTPNSPSSSEDDVSLGQPKNPGIEQHGNDHGREGGHFLICDGQAPIPPSRNAKEKAELTYTKEKVFFIDYFLEINTADDAEKLQVFADDENEYQRLQQIALRLNVLFAAFPQMRDHILRIKDFTKTYMDIKGKAKWIPDERRPFEIELTDDILPESISHDHEVTLKNNCGARFYQAAVYDYTEADRDYFQYSTFFVHTASLMQKSFRNIHEMLRYLMRDETRQIQKLTAYFHTKDFLFGEPDQVRSKISDISNGFKKSQEFYKTQ